MRLAIDASADAPPYAQVREQVVEQVDDGTLPAGTRLPPVRQLATELGLAANTVARAYRELEERGVIETRGRAGSFVRGASVDRVAREAALSYVERSRALGLTGEQAVELVRSLW
ncbi:MAG: HTH-type transcriptional repressor yvoA [Nocardioidaceae bacterium]|nr:HTH-type transcriptional repressor yvoA [Nocardioidaceae bacterium]